MTGAAIQFDVVVAHRPRYVERRKERTARSVVGYKIHCRILRLAILFSVVMNIFSHQKRNVSRPHS